MQVLVVTPMEEEKRAFKDALSSLKIEEPKFKVIQTGIGKVAAASEVAVHLASSLYDCVVVTGYAAATANFKQGDVVICSKTRYSDIFVPENIKLEHDKEFNLVSPMDGPIIFTSDSFVEKCDVRPIIERFSVEQALFDMECAAVADVCEDSNVPVICVKMVSDLPEIQTPQTFNEFVEGNLDFTEILEKILVLLSMVDDT